MDESIDNLSIEELAKIKYLSLEELAKIENLSVRAYHVCEGGRLLNLLEILTFYWENDGFRKLRNCGSRSNEDLIELCKKYQGLIDQPIKSIEINKPENLTEKKILSLSARQKKILNNIIESLISELSVRAANSLETHLNSDYSIKAFQPILSDPKFNIRNLRNIGAKTEKELKNLFIDLRQQIDLVIQFEDEEELTKELFNTYLRKKFGLEKALISEIWKNYESGSGIPLFKTINILIESGAIYDIKQRVIFRKGINYWNSGDKETLENIASELNITRERIRQIRNIIIGNFNSTFSFIKLMDLESINLYGINFDVDIIDIPEDLGSNINETENNSFNNHFIIKIFSILLERTHDLIGNDESIATNKISRSAHNWNNTYLVKKELSNVLNYNAFINDVNSRLNMRIEESYSFQFESYLTNFLTKKSYELNNNIVFICERMIFNEFELSIDIYEQLTFKKNTKKQVVEYVYDVLKEVKRPLNIYQIYELINVKYPNITKSPEALRGSCQRDSNLVYIGRSSTYGLKIWEINELIKGGTMHDIAEEFLIKFEEPKHIDEIKDYVIKFRPEATSKNLYYNLKSAENKRFLFFKNHIVGLISKQYDSSCQLNESSLINRRTKEESLKLLTKFVAENDRLPSYSSKDYNEIKLCRFLRVLLNKGELNDINDQKLKFLVESYYSNGRRRKNSENRKCSYVDLSKFISDNNRMPNSRIETERGLYYFYYKQTSLYKNGELDNETMKEYIEIVDLIHKTNEN